MKIVISLFLLALCSCASLKPVAVVPASLAPPIPPAAAAKVSRVISAPQAPKTITLSWKPDHSVSNEVTVIIEAYDLSLPRYLWAEVFRGATNTCTLPVDATAAEEWFSAYSDFGTNL